MPRKRMIDPGIWQSEQVGSLSRDQRLLFIGIFSNADDAGRIKGSGAYLRAVIFPYDEDLTSADVGLWRDRLAEVGLIRRYVVDDREYADLPSWSRYQRIDKPSASLLPPFAEHSTNDSRTFAEHSPSIRSQVRGIEVRGIEIEGARVAVADAPPKKERKPKEPGVDLAPIFDAFANAGQPRPIIPTGKEVAAAQALVKNFREQLADVPECWEDIASGRYGKDYERRKLSFALLVDAIFQNWLRWKQEGKPEMDSRAAPNVQRSPRYEPPAPVYVEA